MLIAISSNWTGGKGLARDGALIEGILQAAGHEVVRWQFDDNTAGEPVSLIIFLERVNPVLLRFSKRRWLIPNPEWWKSHEGYLLARMDAILCKTHDAVELFARLHPQVCYTGFCSEDHYDEAVLRKPWFLHSPGGSQAKNTEAILEAWDQYALPYRLTLLSEHYTSHNPNIIGLGRVPEAELHFLQNQHMFHLCPSQYEGYGHVIGEALHVGAIVISVNHPPMNEFRGCVESLRVSPTIVFQQGLAMACKVGAEGIARSVKSCANLDHGAIESLSVLARTEARIAANRFQVNLVKLIQRAAELGDREPVKVADVLPVKKPTM